MMRMIYQATLDTLGFVLMLYFCALVLINCHVYIAAPWHYGYWWAAP